MNLRIAERMIRAMMDQHGLTAWKIKWTRAKKTHGLCNYTERTLSFSAVGFLSTRLLRPVLMVNIINGRDWDEPVTVTLTRSEWYEITGAIDHDIFEGNFYEQYTKIYETAFPPKENMHSYGD